MESLITKRKALLLIIFNSGEGRAEDGGAKGKGGVQAEGGRAGGKFERWKGGGRGAEGAVFC